LESPKFTLDQDNTLRAIDAMQLFINLYPKSERVTEASKLIADLRDKLEMKSFANAKLFYDIGDFKSAVIAFKNSLRDYPDTKYAEEMEYLAVKAQQRYAQNSLEIKQEDRFNEVIVLANEFEEDFPTSSHLKEVKEIRTKSEGNIVEVKKLLASMMTPQGKAKQADTTQKN
ncbi:MAG TPA: outer membrane protein assembly factor BamD, partial [Pedobacter sp.]